MANYFMTLASSKSDEGKHFEPVQIPWAASVALNFEPVFDDDLVMSSLVMSLFLFDIIRQLDHKG